MTDMEKELVELCMQMIADMNEGGFESVDYEIILSMIRAKYNK